MTYRTKRTSKSALEERKMKSLSTVVCAAIFAASVSPILLAQDQAKNDERLASATETLNEIMATPDKSIPQSILAGASCVVVVPHFKKGAFVVGAQYGQGVATCRTPQGWSAP